MQARAGFAQRKSQQNQKQFTTSNHSHQGEYKQQLCIPWFALCFALGALQTLDFDISQPGVGIHGVF